MALNVIAAVSATVPTHTGLSESDTEAEARVAARLPFCPSPSLPLFSLPPGTDASVRWPVPRLHPPLQ